MVAGTGETFGKACSLCGQETPHRRTDGGTDRCLICFNETVPALPAADGRGCFVGLLVILLVGGAVLRLIPW